MKNHRFPKITKVRGETRKAIQYSQSFNSRKEQVKEESGFLKTPFTLTKVL